ncbi:unnamed protein product [Paramecium primaurelia]|uniref:Protein kinase domain-containing protein n=1 Tax=Paramecium primaurelia TaxID=5886 RepID=A0A8S1P195_PARPR|nr:unnamed protein product [Paramecium primaurelia]
MFNSAQKRAPPQLYVTPRYRTTQSEYNNPHSERLFEKSKENSFNQLKILQQIGYGKFSKVMLAMLNGEKFALKIINKSCTIKTQTQQHLQREIQIMKQLNHPNIVKLFKDFSDEKNVYLLLEYCNQGSLFNQKFDQTQIKQIIKEVLLALKYLHNQGIMHRDIKPENIYLHNNHVKLGDFGIAQYIKKQSKSFCGTLDYMAPEVINQNFYDNRIDIWSVGILAYELSNLEPPIKDRDQKLQMRRIISEEVQYPRHFDLKLKNFISKCLKKKCDERATIDELLNDEFIHS